MKVQVPSTIILVLRCLSIIPRPLPASAESFLAPPTTSVSLRGDPRDEPSGPGLRKQLEGVLGASYMAGAGLRTGRLEEGLRSTFASLPKGEHGAVGAAAARYALHRLFVQQHGWQLQGLDPSGGNWSVASPTAAFGDRMPTEVKAIFEDHLKTKGFNLQELALFAAMLEHMVHGQIEAQLRSIFDALQHSVDVILDESSAVRAIDAYMASYILGANSSTMTPQMLQQFNSTIEEQHPSWPETRRFLREVQRELRPAATAFSFADVVAVVEEAADRFGQWQSKECLALKRELVAMEDSKGSGRVRLADFYGSAVHGGKWQFSETVDYLRQLGAIDDTNPTGLRVIIPNYIYSPSNCLASSSFYAVCCIDECEELLDHLESSLGRPTATPEEIRSLLSALPSTSGNSTLPAGLVRRLDEVAEHHAGRVPLHGRLLSQWLHHARPRECPYPHLSGSTTPQRPEDWEIVTGQGATATEEEMLQHIEAGHGQRAPAPSDNDEGLCSPMWTMEEELIDSHAHESSKGEAPAMVDDAFAKRLAMRSCAVLAALGSLVFALLKMLSSAHSLGGLHSKKADKLPRYSV